MSSNNNNNGELMVFAFVMAGIIMLGLIIFAVLAFFAFVLTVLSVCAWNRPLHLGKMTLEPEEARGFIARGICGAFLLPVFVMFSEMLFDLRVDWEEYGHFIVIGGYIAGSIGIGILMEEEAKATAAPEYLPPIMSLPASPEPVRREPNPAPFRFATWEDEGKAEEPKSASCNGCARSYKPYDDRFKL